MSASVLCACGEQQQEMADKVYVGVTCYNQSDTFLGELLDCFKEQMDELETDELETIVTVRDAAGSQRTQNDQVRELINAGCNVLCVNLVDRADPSEVIDLARENDVPIIFFNREPVAEDLLQWEQMYYVGADAKESGVMQGEVAAEVILSDDRIDRNNDGKIQYVVLEGEPGHQDAIIRTENAVSYTHLDVYKRQSVHSFWQVSSMDLVPGLSVREWLDPDPQLMDRAGRQTQSQPA